MANRKPKPYPVTWDQVSAFRLSRHHLMERAMPNELPSVVRDMAGAQAQLFSAAQISIWSRIQNLQISQIEEAISKRTLVKAACMRRTLFLAPSESLAIFVRGSAKRAEKEIRWARRKGVPIQLIEGAIKAALSVLDEPLTRPEIAERTCRALGVQMQIYRGGGWGSRRKLDAVPVGEYKGRRHLVDAQHHPSVFRPQGWISPVVLVDGRVEGVWKYTQEGNHLQVEVTQFILNKLSWSAC